MNTTPDEASRGQTGRIDKTEAPDSQYTIEEPRVIQERIVWGSTHPFGGTMGEGTDLPKDEDNIREGHTNRERIILEQGENLRLLTLLIIDQCEEEFHNGLVTGRDELDSLNHVFSHLLNGIPLDLYGQMDHLELVQSYFDKVRLIVQTYVEYLHFVRNIDWYKLKVFLANMNLFLKKTYKEEIPKNDHERRNLKILNSFLPDLVTVLKDKEHLDSFTTELIEMIRYMRKNNGMNLVTLLETTELSEIAFNFRNTYLNCSAEYLYAILNKIHANLVLEDSSITSQRVGEMEKVPFFNLIRQLNSERYLGNNLDFFINALTRGIRLDIIPDQADAIFKRTEKNERELRWDLPIPEFSSGLKSSIPVMQAQSNSSIYRTEDLVNGENRPRVMEKEISGKIIEDFNNKMFQLISAIPEFPPERAEQNNYPPQTLKRLFSGDMTLIVREPEALVEFFCKIFESAIININNRIFENSGMIIAEKNIVDLFYIWKNEFEKRFEMLMQANPVRILESSDFYFSTYFERYEETQADILLHPAELFAHNLSTRLKNKVAIIDARKNALSPKNEFKQFVLAILSSGLRDSKLASNDYYYADTLEEVIEDLESFNPSEDVMRFFVDHVIVTISQNIWPLFGKLDKRPAAFYMARLFKKNARLQEYACKFLSIDNNPDILEARILEYISKSPTKKLVES